MEKVPCKYCGHKPKIVPIDGLFYAQCTNCTKYDPYEFVGRSENKVLATWNDWQNTNFQNNGRKAHQHRGHK